MLHRGKIRKKNFWGSSLSFWSLWISFTCELICAFKEMFTPYLVFPNVGAGRFFTIRTLTYCSNRSPQYIQILSKCHSLHSIYRLFLATIYSSSIIQSVVSRITENLSSTSDIATSLESVGDSILMNQICPPDQWSSCFDQILQTLNCKSSLLISNRNRNKNQANFGKKITILFCFLSLILGIIKIGKELSVAKFLTAFRKKNSGRSFKRDLKIVYYGEGDTALPLSTSPKHFSEVYITPWYFCMHAFFVWKWKGVEFVSQKAQDENKDIEARRQKKRDTFYLPLKWESTVFSSIEASRWRPHLTFCFTDK